MRLLNGSRNVSFDDLANLAEGFGFRLSRVRGSHHFFVHSAIPEVLIQPTGQAKRYQASNFSTWSRNTISSRRRTNEEGLPHQRVLVRRGSLLRGRHPRPEVFSAFGESPEEALRGVSIAKEGWLETARD